MRRVRLISIVGAGREVKFYLPKLTATCEPQAPHLYSLITFKATKLPIIFYLIFCEFVALLGVGVSLEQKTGLSLKVLSYKDFIEGCGSSIHEAGKSLSTKNQGFKL
jgi:hypothetical protein